MTYMLDTDTCSYILRRQPPELLTVLYEKANTGVVICISVISYQELRFGAERAGSSKHHESIDAFCDRIDFVADWMTEEVDTFAKLQTELFSKGTPIAHNDMMIGAHALSIGATLVTNNVRHFSMVPGLLLESWVR